ncbi:MAG: sigma-54 dependent transcriptional regulator [Candidatus Ratteibacteria bacterium]|nr:sigma-54 dependent transcriptional regulator [Candidatus Ratteibacteria bacterium]
MNPKILIVEDESNMRKTLSSILEEEGFISVQAAQAKEGLKILSEQNISLIISDIKMPQMDGIEFLREVRTKGYDIPLIFITAYGSFDSAVEALRLGAYDYITKPFEPETVVHTVKRALEHKKLTEENIYLREELERKYGFEGLVGNTQCMRDVYALIEKVADSKVPVLLRGESGTGKELVARAIHKISRRKDKNFVVINCGALPETLLESEIFGHEKGAFTGADKKKPGIFEIGNEGTIFLDEVGDLSPSVQMKLLRFLQSEEFIRVGGTTPLKVDVRIISATNKNLDKLIEEKRFRDDLYYRINTVSINIPPLRDRKEDIPLLIDHFLKKYSKEDNIPIKKVSEEVLRVLCEYPWRGNVRELENLIRAALVLSKGNVIKIEDIPPVIRQADKSDSVTGKNNIIPSPSSEQKESFSFKQIREKAEKEYLIYTLKKTAGNISKASKLAGLSRRHFYDKIQQYGINPRKL